MEINIDLSSGSVRKAIEQLKAYKEDISKKNKLFVERLALLGIPVIQEAISFNQGDSDPNVEKEIILDTDGDVAKAVLRIRGKDVLFFEFGSGIHYNPTNAPHAEKFGYGVGTYPGQKHAFDEKGWFYRDATGLHHSYGTQATMPMLKASNQIIRNIRKIAREVYGSK